MPTTRAMPKSMTFTAPGLGEHDVGGLEIAMDDAQAVSVRERGQRLHAEVRGLRSCGERAFARHERLERLAAHELHDHEPLAFVLEQLVDGGDARMIQTCNGDGFRAKPASDRWIVQLGVEDLDGDVAMKGLVDRTVHRAHAATADAIRYSVLADVLSDHASVSTCAPLPGKIRSLGGPTEGCQFRALRQNRHICCVASARAPVRSSGRSSRSPHSFHEPV